MGRPSSKPIAEIISDYQITADIKELASQGWTRRDMAELLDVEPSKIHALARSLPFHIPLGDVYPRRPEIDALLTGEYTTQEIATLIDPIKKCGQSVRSYLLAAGKIDLYRARRRAHKRQTNELQNSRADIIRALTRHSLNLAQKHSPGARAALERYFHHGHTQLAHQLNFLEEYYSAKNGTASHTELAKKTKYTPVHISHLLQHFNEKALHSRRTRHIIAPWAKDAMERTLDSGAPSGDIAYFLGIEGYHVKQNLKLWYPKYVGPRPHYIGISGKIGSYPTCLRHASQIYQAEDWNWSISEIAYALDKDVLFVDYFLHRREEFSSKIIDLLHTLYPSQVFTVPYLHPMPNGYRQKT